MTCSSEIRDINSVCCFARHEATSISNSATS